jgi:hypothetical protein
MGNIIKKGRKEERVVANNEATTIDNKAMMTFLMTIMKHWIKMMKDN